MALSAGSSNDGEAQYLLAKSLKATGPHDEAQQADDEARRLLDNRYAKWEIAPEQMPILARMKTDFSRAAYYKLERQQQRSAALPSTQLILQQQVFDRARRLASEGKDVEALAELQRLLDANGSMSEAHLLKAQLQTSNIELSLADAESNWRLANINMDIMLGLPEKTILVQDTSGIDAPADVQGIEAYEKQALESRKDVKALSFRQKAATTGVKIARGEYYPAIALTGGYIAADVPGLLTITNAVNIGVGVQYNLSSLWKTKAKLQQARAREQQLQADEEDLNDRIRYQINEAYEGYLLSRKKIEVYEKAIAQATENYKITKNKYDNSLVTTTELLDADVAQLQAKLNHAFAKADAMVAYNKLLQSAGLL